MSDSASFYTLRAGDTLSKVAKRHGTSVRELCKINGIKNPNKVARGQRIALKAQAVCKVGIQLLDRDRNPIPNAKVALEHCGKFKELSSGKNGRLPDILTDTPEDIVKIFIARADGSWKEITQVVSGWGNKLVTLVSPSIRIQSETRVHPKDETGMPKRDRTAPRKKASIPNSVPRASKAEGKLQNTFGDDKGTKINDAATPDGLPINKITNDQSSLDFLGGYTGEKITDDDYKKAALALGCEVEVIRAIGEQESGKLRALGLGSFDKKNRPTILYERHYFSRLTKRKYDALNPDISSPNEYKAGTAKNDKGTRFDDGNHYGLFSWQYAKLSKAYALDQDMAIQSCSWGAFQVMGANYKSCGFNSAHEFAKAMSKSELEHLNAMVAFCKANNLQNALKTKNWAVIAKTYNGPKYAKNKYDTHLRQHYETLIKNKTSQ